MMNLRHNQIFSLLVKELTNIAFFGIVSLVLMGYMYPFEKGVEHNNSIDDTPFTVSDYEQALRSLEE